MTTILTGSEIFKRTATYERDASSIRLHAPQWKLLLTFDGQRALSEVALNGRHAVFRGDEGRGRFSSGATGSPNSRSPWRNTSSGPARAAALLAA